MSIVDPSGTELETPTATVDTVNTTLSAAAAVDATSVTLTSVSGVSARRHYVVSGADGQREWVRVRAVNTSTRVVTLYEPVAAAYASGAAFYGTDITATVDGDSVDDLLEGYEARWEFTVDGATEYGVTRFDAVHTVWPATLTTTRELRSYAGPLVGRDVGRDTDADFEDVLEHAYNRVIEDVRARGRDPSRFRSVEPWKRVVHEAALLHLAEQADVIPSAYRDNPEGWLRVRREKYDDVMSATLSAASDYDDNQDGAVSAGEAAQRMQIMWINL